MHPSFTLYHQWLAPESIRVRFHLQERGIDFQLKFEKTWKRRIDFLKINPAGTAPVLVVNDKNNIAGARVISEYLEELPDLFNDNSLPYNLFGKTPEIRAEARRMLDWFDGKFQQEVILNIVDEKLMRHLLKQGSPRSHIIKAGMKNLRNHLNYCEWLLNRHDWLIANYMTVVDMAAASSISTLDYLNMMPWEEYPETRNWYARIKSRKTFQTLLQYEIPSLPPPYIMPTLTFKYVF